MLLCFLLYKLVRTTRPLGLRSVCVGVSVDSRRIVRLSALLSPYGAARAGFLRSGRSSGGSGRITGCTRSVVADGQRHGSAEMALSLNFGQALSQCSGLSTTFRAREEGPGRRRAAITIPD